VASCRERLRQATVSAPVTALTSVPGSRTVSSTAAATLPPPLKTGMAIADLSAFERRAVTVRSYPASVATKQVAPATASAEQALSASIPLARKR